MDKKIQYKFHIKNLEDFKNMLIAFGIEFSAPIVYAYSYFKSNNSSDSDYTVLRIKLTEGKKSVDLKIRNNDTQEWEHFESGIDDEVQMANILKTLGNKFIHTFHKHRQTWKNDFVRFDLDTTKELGTFLEAKFSIENKEKASELIAKLGFDPAKNDKRSVIEIYLAKNQI